MMDLLLLSFTARLPIDRPHASVVGDGRLGTSVHAGI